MLKSTVLTPVKDKIVANLVAPVVRDLVTAASSRSLVIVMMHRFGLGGGRGRHCPETLRGILQALRSARVELIDVEGALEDLSQSKRVATRHGRLRPRIAFTIDDGYADALEIGGPVFSEFDCPVTCFVVPEVVDGREWYWWDKIETMLQRSSHVRLDVMFEEARRSFELRTDQDRRVAFAAMSDWTKQIPAQALPAFLENLSRAAEAELPLNAPPEYRVLSWDQMRRAEGSGWRFGAHTMTHPVLARCTDSQADWEIGESVARVQARLNNPSNVFCYPVGRESDYGEREIEILRRHHVQWALSAEPGVIRPNSKRLEHASWPWRLPRFAHDERPGGVMRMLLGW